MISSRRTYKEDRVCRKTVVDGFIFSLVLIYCPVQYAVDPAVCDRGQVVRDLLVLEDIEDSNDEMETTFTTFKPCDGMDTGSPLQESAGLPEGVDGSESFANPLYETAGNVTGKLAWSKPMMIEIQRNGGWVG